MKIIIFKEIEEIFFENNCVIYDIDMNKIAKEDKEKIYLIYNSNEIFIREKFLKLSKISVEDKLTYSSVIFQAKPSYILPYSYVYSEMDFCPNDIVEQIYETIKYFNGKIKIVPYVV